MVDDDPEKRSGRKQWIDRTERAVVNASANIAGEEIVKDAILLLKKHIGQFMSFQGTEQEQAKQCRIRTLSDSIAGQQREEPCIILPFGGFFDCLS